MAKVSDAADDQPAAEPKTGGGSKKLILIIAAALALVGTSVGGSYLTFSLLHKEAPAAKSATKKAKAAAAKDAEADNDAEKEAEAEDAGDAAKSDTAGDAADKEVADAEDDAEATDAEGNKIEATYVDFEQPIVANFMDDGQLRYLQIGISVLVKNPATVADVKRHMPRIRNNLVMLFSGQSRDAIIGRDGKEKVRLAAEAEVQKVLKEQTGKPGIKALFFTSFVMQ
jgi:flagellar FliL protein